MNAMYLINDNATRRELSEVLEPQHITTCTTLGSGYDTFQPQSVLQ